MTAVAPGRCRISVGFDDGTTSQVHYMVVPSFADQVSRLGHHWATVSWLPRDYPDPFGRGASVMPYDRERREIVLDDSRAYNVGLSDDAGGGNPGHDVRRPKIGATPGAGLHGETSRPPAEW